MTFLKEGSPNPMNVNHPRVHAALSEAIPGIKKGAEFKIFTPVTLSLRDGAHIDANLLYQSEIYWPTDKTSPCVVTLAIEKDNVFLSERTWTTSWQDYGDEPKHLRIRSKLETKPSWEGNGFGASLVLETNVVIDHILKHWKKQWSPTPVIAVIVDLAKGKTRTRDQWTTGVTQELGYVEHSPLVFYKTYHI